MIGDTTKICIRQDKEFGIQQKPRAVKFREDGAKEGGGGGGLPLTFPSHFSLLSSGITTLLTFPYLAHSSFTSDRKSDKTKEEDSFLWRVK